MNEYYAGQSLRVVSVTLPVHLSTCLPIYLSTYAHCLSNFQSTCPSVRVSVFPSGCPSAVNEDMVAGLVEEAHGDAHLAVLNVVQT